MTFTLDGLSLSDLRLLSTGLSVYRDESNLDERTEAATWALMERLDAMIEAAENGGDS